MAVDQGGAADSSFEQVGLGKIDPDAYTDCPPIANDEFEDRFSVIFNRGRGGYTHSDGMVLVYITRVRIPSGGAQARQICCMSQAYHKLLGSRFLMLCGGAEDGSVQFPCLWVSDSGSQKRRYLAVCIKTAGTVLRNRQVLVATRDIAVAFTALLFGGRVVYEAHDRPRGFAAGFLSGVCIGSRRFHLVTNCHALARYYSRRFRISHNRVLARHNGCFSGAYDALKGMDKQELRSILGLPDDRCLVVHTGSLYKGGAELFGHVAHYDSRRIFFVHVGGSPQECDRWSLEYRRRGISNIRFVVQQSPDEIRNYQRAADLLFYVSTRNSPIWQHTSPLKLFEYMASGTPIMGTTLGSLEEILCDSNAMLYDPDDPVTIRDALDRYFGDPQLGASIADNAARDAAGRYSWDDRVRAIITFAGAGAFSNAVHVRKTSRCPLLAGPSGAIRRRYDRVVVARALRAHIARNRDASGSDHIPKVIYQTVADKWNLHPLVEENVGKLKAMNPGWRHELYDDDDQMSFMSKYASPEQMEAYLRIDGRYGAARADLFRYVLMYQRGGVYLDVKSSAEISFDAMLMRDDEYILSHWKGREHREELANEHGEYQQWHLISRPFHPFLLAVIERVCDNIRRYCPETDGVGKSGVLRVTGPIAYTKAIEPLRGTHRHTAYLRHEYIGLVYSIASKRLDFISHAPLLGTRHYSQLTAPIVVPHENGRGA